jgi:hypothetical protein
MILRRKIDWLRSVDETLRPGSLHHRLQLIGFDWRGQIFRAEAMGLELADRIRSVVHDDRGGVCAKRLRVLHQVQAVVGLQSQIRNQQIDVIVVAQ